jgi:hypothetical protein
MSWKKVTIADADGIKIESLQTGYKLRWQAMGAPDDAIVLINKEAPAEGVHIFFNPRAVLIAGPLLRTYAPEDCAQPDPATVAVFVSRE